MRWTNTEARTSPRKLVQRCRLFLDKKPDSPLLWSNLGSALMSVFDVAGAAEAFARAMSLDPAGFRDYDDFAGALFALGRDLDALAVLDRAEENGFRDLRSESTRAHILLRLGRHGEAIQACKNAMAMGENAFTSAEIFLSSAAQTRDGAKILAACDELPVAYRRGAACFAYRAIGLSILGRHDEARALIDLERQVIQIPFEPPREFGSLEAFHAQLMSEIADGAVAFQEEPGKREPAGLKNVNLHVNEAIAFPALAAWIRNVMNSEIPRLQADGLNPVLAELPEAVLLHTEGYIFRHSGHTGRHIHAADLLSGVYHVKMPDAARLPEKDGGVLHLGCAPKQLADYAPCWQMRKIRPVPGTLTLFPSHICHDFAPTHCDQPRAAIGIGLRASAGLRAQSVSGV